MYLVYLKLLVSKSMNPHQFFLTLNQECSLDSLDPLPLVT